MVELYIFNKECKDKNGLSYWQSDSGLSSRISLIYNLDRFKAKSTAEDGFFHKSQEDLIEILNQNYKENSELKIFFDQYTGQTIEIQLVKDFHHIAIYDNQILYIDSNCIKEFAPIYLFAIYYTLAKSDRKEDDIYRQLPTFLQNFNEPIIEELVRFLHKDKQGPRIYDAGGHLLQYLKNINHNQWLETQLLRNRTLAGALPYDLTAFENISERYQDDPFCGEAVREYFEILQESFNSDFAQLYYQHLTESLRTIGLGIVAQRGSRVAHEQGPILINSGSIDINEETAIFLRKMRSNLNETLSKIHDYSKKHLHDVSPEISMQLTQQANTINLEIDGLVYLSTLKNPAKARINKAIDEIKANFKAYINTLLDSAEHSSTKNEFLHFYDHIKIQQKDFYSHILDINDRIDKINIERQKAVIYIQRPSSRSGHFIARLILGQNLYVETDTESEEQRVNAIPFNFVSPELDYVANNIDSFFENASISIATNRDTGKPSIKWENAEDLAITLAPSMYHAIKSSQARGSTFHYQLETTLFGPLIELFINLLEHEISNIASIDHYYGNANLKQISNQQLQIIDGQDSCQSLIANYHKEVVEAADFTFKYYILEDELQQYMLQENLDQDKAKLELILNLRDVQHDIANYCLLKRRDTKLFAQTIKQIESIDPNLGLKAKVKQISALLNNQINPQETRDFIKKYIRYPESTARKEFLEKSHNLNPIVVTSNKNIKNADYYYNFTVAPSRIDFGKHVVASITTMMGRILGANDQEALSQGKEYIDFVSRTSNSLFDSAAEAGSVKVIENTCRAIQYSKAIAFQGSFQQFGIDGALARMTINARNSKSAGLHVMEYGTMASTGYCITKEPLFILLGLSLDSDSILEKLGITNEQTKKKLKDFIYELLESRSKFKSHLDWELFAYEELSNSTIIQQYLSDPQYKWLPNLNSLITLVKYISDTDDLEQNLSRAYAQLTSKLIEFSRIINETGIIERVQLMNSAIKRAKLQLNINKAYNELHIGLNASYKGNVSDERENANQYILALLLHQKQYLKNASIPEIATLIDHQCNHYPIPEELRIIDPLVDPDVFMGGELKNIAENTIQKLVSLNFQEKLDQKLIHACMISYGSNLRNWPCLNKRLKQVKDQQQIQDQLKTIEPELKYLELYCKGFYKDPLEGFQGLDVIQLNSDHDQIKSLIENLPLVKNLMQINNPDSLLVLVDNPQQAKRPFLDYDKTLEWLSLDGTVASHQIAEEKYEKWRKEIESSKVWAKLFIQTLVFSEHLPTTELESNLEYNKTRAEVITEFREIQRYSDLKRDLIIQKFNESKEMGMSNQSFERYSEWIQCLQRIRDYQDLEEVTFNDWLILGGRWVLNNAPKQDIDYVINLFDKSQNLRHLDKKGYHLLELYIHHYSTPTINHKERIIEKAGSTKEADLLMVSASDNLEHRSLINKQTQALILRLEEFKTYDIKIRSAIDTEDLNQLENHWDYLINDYLICLNKKASANQIGDLNVRFARLLKTLELFARKLSYLDTGLLSITTEHIKVRNIDDYNLNLIFGDHRKSGGIFQKLAQQATSSTTSDEDNGGTLQRVSKLGEMFIDSYLIMLTISTEDENLMVNKLATFFDQYLNIHEEDYPPYMFHGLCAGASYGFNQTYYLDPNLRSKMFKLACKAGINTYKILHYLISNQTILKHSPQEYKDGLIGDYDNGIIPIGYQHETICIEERFWDCMRALRNFIRNYHDKHPLPIIIKSSDATVEKLFRYGLTDNVKLNWIAGLANIGKHSWDLNCVFRSPLLRQRIQTDDHDNPYCNISIFTPYLTQEGQIKQIYTSFKPNIIEEQDIHYLSPFAANFKYPLYQKELVQGKHGNYLLNEEGFVHTLVLLEKSKSTGLPEPNIIMSAHTHPQYISGFTAELGIPETWSMLSMLQMYSKTVLPEILAEASIKSLAQMEFGYKSFSSIAEVEEALDLKAQIYQHIDHWILKTSRDSGGRGISSRLNIYNDKQEIIEFIYNKTRSDDVVMQEFVPNNAYAFINKQFINTIKNAFIESGTAIRQITPAEHIYFAMRSFQSLTGIKGYLFSANIGSVTVNAGQGAKMFYGEPIYIMPIYIAGKIQKLLDETGDFLLKEAIPRHAQKFAITNHIPIINNKIGSNNCFMLNGLFDYIPYLYAARADKQGIVQQFKVIAQNNSLGGLDYYYSYYGKQILLCSGSNQEESLNNLEQMLKQSANGEWQGEELEIDIGLAVIELNSGLGQANLLQKAILAMAPENKDLFLEWTEDLGAVAMSSQQV